MKYLPLEFVDYIDNLYKGGTTNTGAPDFVSQVIGFVQNKLVGRGFDKFVEMLADNYNCLLLSESTGYSQSVYDFIKEFNNTNGLKIGMASAPMFAGMVLDILVAKAWSKYKLSYKINTNKTDSFISVGNDSVYPNDILLKLPAPCFYIDVEDSSSIGDLKGIFVLQGECKDTNNIILYPIFKDIEYRHNCYTLTVSNTARYDVPIAKSVSFKKIRSTKHGILSHESYIAKVFFSFCDFYKEYHVADSKDIIRVRPELCESLSEDVSEHLAELKRISKQDDNIRYSKAIHTSNAAECCVDLKDVSNQGLTNHAKQHRAAHYRAAHWHNYWVGVGERRRLEPRWIEGTFCNGSVSEVVSIHIVS